MQNCRTEWKQQPEWSVIMMTSWRPWTVMVIVPSKRIGGVSGQIFDSAPSGANFPTAFGEGFQRRPHLVIFIFPICPTRSTQFPGSRQSHGASFLFNAQPSEPAMSSHLVVTKNENRMEGSNVPGPTRIQHNLACPKRGVPCDQPCQCSSKVVRLVQYS